MFAWFLTAILGAAFVWLSLLNWYALIRQTLGKPSPSWIPLLGGMLGVLALWSAPGKELDRIPRHRRFADSCRTIRRCY